MTEPEALAALEAMVAAGENPTLSSGELYDILRLCRRSDRWGRWPADAGWVPTWDLSAAAAEGWRRKAGKVAGAYDFGGLGGQGQSYSRSQMHAMCLEMARQYSRGAVRSVPLSTVLGVAETDILGNVNDG